MLELDTPAARRARRSATFCPCVWTVGAVERSGRRTGREAALSRITGSAVLAESVERASGIESGGYLTEAVFEPLG